MPQNAFFLRTRDLLVSQKTTQIHIFPTLHPLSTVIFATATVLACTLRLRNSRFNFHCRQWYTAWSNAYSEIGPEVRCDLSRLLARKITKRIHSGKAASLNRPIYTASIFIWSWWHQRASSALPSPSPWTASLGGHPVCWPNGRPPSLPTPRSRHEQSGIGRNFLLSALTPPELAVARSEAPLQQTDQTEG